MVRPASKANGPLVKPEEAPVEAPQMTVQEYVVNRIAALEAEMHQLQVTYGQKQAARDELKRMTF